MRQDRQELQEDLAAMEKEQAKVQATLQAAQNGGGNIPPAPFARATAVMGYVGKPGNSFGAHLHFEVRVNGSPVSPLSYL